MSEIVLDTIDIHNVAKRLNVCERTVKRWSDDGTMPAPARIGGRLLRWNVPELNEWAKRGFPVQTAQEATGEASQ